MATDSKIDIIKQKALQNKVVNIDDYDKMVVSYKEQIKKWQNDINADDNRIKELDNLFFQKKEQILNNQELARKEKEQELEKEFVSYAIEKAKLNRVGNSIVFFDKSQGSYVELSRIKKKDIITGEEKVERILESRDDKTIKKMINKDAKEKLGNILPARRINVIVEWLNIYTKIFAPLQMKMYGDFYNVYTPNGFLELKVKNVIDLDNFADNILPEKFPHINALFKNLAPKDDERKYVLNWLSYILNTANKTRNAIAFIGIQGSGKGVLQEHIIEYAIHPDNSYTITNDDLKSQFNSYLEDRLFLFFNEIKTSFNETSTQADKIKPIITDSRLPINAKHIRQYSIDNYANCMFFSNHDLPFQIEDKDRRYSVIKTEHRTLKQVAKEDFNISIKKFISNLKKERDDFLIYLKMLKLTKQSEELALSILDNETKRKIKEQTNTFRDTLKIKIVERDIEWFDEYISDVIDGQENSKLIERHIDELIFTDEGEKVVKKPVLFKYTNQEFKQYMLDEVKQGIFTNTTLKWFTKVAEIESANSNHKFGKFWNLVINQSQVITLMDGGKKIGSIKLRFLDIEKATAELVMLHGEEYTFKEGTHTILQKGEIPF